ncbi:MAG: hypothetical protein ACRDIU_04370 [Actinomycetota bacterium]
MKRFALTAAALMLAAACSGGGDKGKLVDAFRDLGQRQNLSVVFTFQSDRDSLRALRGDDPEFPQEIFDKLLKSSVTVSSTGSQDPEKSRSRFIVNLDGVDSFEIRSIGTDLYARADLDQAAEAFGIPDADVEALRQIAGQPGLEFIREALEGKWLKLVGLDSVLKQFGGSTGPTPAAITAAQKKLIAELAGTLDKSAEVRKVGEDRAGEHLAATVALRQFLPALNRFVDEFAGSGTGLGLKPEDVPDEKVRLDAWVKDDRLTQLEFDFVKNAKLVDPKEAPPKGVEKFGFRLNFEDFSENIEAPKGAVTIDPSKILQAILGSISPGKLAA